MGTEATSRRADGSALFDRRPTAPGPAGAGEPVYELLSRAEGALWERVRSTLEGWAAAFPESGRKDVVGRMRSNKDRDFTSALWELYMHRVLCVAGYEVEVHPPLRDTSARPDFLAWRGGAGCYVECVVAFGADAEYKALNRVNQVLDTLDGVRSPNFSLAVAVLEQGDTPLRVAKHRIEQWLDGLDPDEMAARLATDGDTGEVFPLLQADGWNIEISPSPKPAEERGRDGLRPVAFVAPYVPGPIDDVGPIRRGLAKKAGSYGQPDFPFVVAVLCDRWFSDDRDVYAALYGSSAVDTGSTPPRPVRMSHGFFERAEGCRNRRVSAVVSAHQLGPTSLASTALTTWHHPAARRPVDLGLGITDFSRVDGRLRRASRVRASHDVVGLPEGWPECREQHRRQ